MKGCSVEGCSKMPGCRLYQVELTYHNRSDRPVTDVFSPPILIEECLKEQLSRANTPQLKTPDPHDLIAGQKR